MAENSVTPNAFNSLEIDFRGVLCDFRFGNHDCLVVELARESAIPIDDEICRFNVNDRCCAIVIKAPVQKTNELTLNIILSARELQIATLVALGYPNKQVADKLHISEWTVATYLRRVFAKLGVDTRAAMTYRCASLISKQDVF